MRKKLPVPADKPLTSAARGYTPFAADPRTATPRSLRQSSIDELLLLAISGGEDPTIAGAIEANARELEIVYEHFQRGGDLWASSVINVIQQRLRVLAEVARRRGLGLSDTPPPESQLPEGSLDLVEQVRPLGGV